MSRSGRSLSVIGMVIVTASLFAADKHYEESFKLEPGGQLVMNVRVGNVHVQSWDRNEVSFEADVHGSERFVSDFNFDFDRSDARLEIKGDLPYRKWNWGFRTKVAITMRVPQHCHLDLKTSGGNIEVQDVRGQSNLHTSGGNLRLANLEGDLVAKTSGGDIRASGITGQTQLGTSGGNIYLEDLSGDIDARTSGGNIDLLGVEGEIVAKTSGGNIEMRLVGPYKGVQASTSGGHIHCYVDGDLSANLNARTSGGRVTVDFPITIRGKISNSKVQGTINGGGPPLELHSSGGNIKVLSAK